MIDGIQSAQISQKQDGHNIYAIMKTMCPLGYHHNGFEATHALGHMMYGIYTYVCIYTVYIYIYIQKFTSKCRSRLPILRKEIARARKRF